MLITLLLLPVLLILEIGHCCTVTELFKNKIFPHNSNITDDSLKHIKNLNDDDWEYVATFSEAMVFEIPRLFSVSANNFIEFSRTQIILFKKIFIFNEVASFDNIAVLSDMFNSGHAMQGGIDEILCIILRKSEEPKCGLTY